MINYQLIPGMDEGDEKKTSAPLLIDYHDTSCIEDGYSTCDEETLAPKDEYTREQTVSIGKRLSSAALVKLVRRVREVRTVSLLVFAFAVLSLVGLVVGLAVGLNRRDSSVRITIALDIMHASSRKVCQNNRRPSVPSLPYCNHPATWVFDLEDRSPLEHPGFHHAAEASFELSASVNVLTFVALGDVALANGMIEIVDSETVSDVVKVNITGYYNDVGHFLRSGQACTFRHGGTHSVEISVCPS